MKERTFVVLLVVLLSATSLGVQAAQSFPRAVPHGLAGPEESSLPHTIIIGWDGVQRDRFWKCYNGELPECPNGLPNIRWLSGDQIYDLTVTDGATETKPGWAQILSGYDVETMGIPDNFDYQPLPEGYSIFEKLERYYGDEAIDTVFVSGKGINVAGTCPGELNVLGRTEEQGEPWCLTKRSIDYFVNAEVDNIPTSVIGERAVAAISEHFVERADKAMFAFFHFAEPDATGHDFGVDSVEYSQALIDLDNWLQAIVAELLAYDAYENALVYVLSDHGFDEGSFAHWNAPYGIFASNDPLIVRSGDRKDLTPTLLERYGVSEQENGTVPVVDGDSLYDIPAGPCTTDGEAYLDIPGAPACCEGLSLVSLSKYDDWWFAKDRCMPATGGAGLSSGYCTACGDGQCSLPETVCNCPADCASEYGGFGDYGGVQWIPPAPLAVECPPGTVKTTLMAEDFATWPPAGWSLINNGGDCSIGNNYGRDRANLTGGSGLCVDADSDRCGPGTTMDVELRTPILDLSSVSNTFLQYKSFYFNYLSEDAAYVDISTDAGATWTNLVTWSEDHNEATTVDLEITPFTGSAQTLIRWHYVAPGWNWYWEIDDVDIAVCAPAPPAVYFGPDFQQNAGCPDTTLQYGLSVWNKSGAAGMVSLDYDSAWPIEGPTEIYVASDETASFDVLVQITAGDVDTATIMASIGDLVDQAQLKSWNRWNWSLDSPVPTPRGDLAVVASGDGLYAIGGTVSGAAPGFGENERLDLQSGEWTTMAPMPVPMTLIDGAEIDGVIYIPGGHDGTDFSTAMLAYDTLSDSWIVKSPAPREVAGYGAVACDGLLYRVGGGFSPTWPAGDHGAEVYDPATDTWSPLPTMVHGHLWPGVGCADGKLYVAGGIDDDMVTGTGAEVYDIEGGYWSDEAMRDLPINWWGSADLLMDGVLFLAGGRFAGEERGAVFMHDLFYTTWTDYWTLGPVLQVPRYRVEGDSTPEAGYVLGGWGDIWSAHQSIEILQPCATPPHEMVYVSSTSDGTAGGISFHDEDILVYDPELATWALFFDGSDVGLSSSNSQDIDAFDFLADASILFSIAGDTSIPGVGAVDDSDIVRFIPTSMGPDTAGSFELYFDGSDVGLSSSKEDLDAIQVLEDGRLVVSTVDSFSVTGVSGYDEDLIVFAPQSLGWSTSGTWELYFDGSDVGLTSNSEDVNGLYIDDNSGDIYLSTLWSFSVQGSSGDGSDVFICHPGSLGSSTTCTFGPGLYWDGSSAGFAGEVVDGLTVGLSE